MTAAAPTLVAMLLAAAKLLTPLAVAGLLLSHQLTASAAPGLGLAGSTGAAGCAASSQDAACATLFAPGGAPLWPGGPARTAAITITTTGTPTEFGLYLTNFTSRDPRSAASCTAPDPAAALNLTIRQDGRAIYEGTLSDFAAQHAAAPSLLRATPTPDRASTFEIAVALDRSADNAYMGCTTATGITWHATA